VVSFEPNVLPDDRGICGFWDHEFRVDAAWTERFEEVETDRRDDLVLHDKFLHEHLLGEQDCGQLHPDQVQL
jgi:hypothetical protein